MSTKQQIFDIVNERTNGPICYLNDTLDEHAGRILEALDLAVSERLDEVESELRVAESELSEKIKIIDEFSAEILKMKKATAIDLDAYENLIAILEG